MTDSSWHLDSSDGELLVRTGVTGRASKFGHRLAIAMDSWYVTVRWRAGQPVTAELTVKVDSLRIRHGEGGLTPLSGPEKMLVRSNALKTLQAGRFPEIRFRSDDIQKTADGYRLTGTLEIHGSERKRALDLNVEHLGDSWRMSLDADVRQSEFGVKPYSVMMGAMKVVDNVTVSFNASRFNQT